MNIILEIHGGLGKSIASTAVCSKIKKKYPNSKLIVVTFWKDVFLNNPHVDICLNQNEDSEFYEKYIENKDVLFLLEEIYVKNSFLNKKKHLMECWFELLGESYNGELPELYFTTQEKQYYYQFFKTPKPLFVIQPNGGVPNQPGMDKYNWARDIPPNIVQKIIDKYKDEYTVGIIRDENQIKYNNCIDLIDKWRMVAIGMKVAKKRLLIDSSFQHIAAAMDLKATVLWNVTDSSLFGYTIHDNIKANPYTKKQKSTTTFSKFRLTEPLQNMPYDSFNDVFDFDKIIESIEKQ
jgi:ADP-heptose:LPS heptosyltransferase